MKYVFYTTVDFDKSVKKLHKKYKTILTDLEQFKKDFEKNPDIGVDLGQGYHKIRMVIKGKNKGKSGGARIITYELYVKVLENETGILLVDLYDKNEIENLSESVYTSITRKFLIHRSD